MQAKNTNISPAKLAEETPTAWGPRLDDSLFTDASDWWNEAQLQNLGEHLNICSRDQWSGSQPFRKTKRTRSYAHETAVKHPRSITIISAMLTAGLKTRWS